MKEKVIIALDFSSAQQALQIVDELTPSMRAQLEPIVGVKPAGETETPPS